MRPAVAQQGPPSHGHPKNHAETLPAPATGRAPTAATSGSAAPLTLGELELLALERNPTLAQAAALVDVSRARAFYEALGWRLDGGVDDETDHVAFFQTPGLILALWDRGKLAEDSGVEDGGGWGGVTLAYNVGSPAEVDAVLAEARAAGAIIARSGAATFWGGYSGVFIDPDGHPWEVAHNPGWTVHEDGRTTIH